MTFKTLKLQQWKQFQNIDIEFHDRLTVLTGANGSGKTTLLHLLARHFGWDFQELATPAPEKETGFMRYFTRFFKKNEPTNNQKIGEISYDNSMISDLLIPNSNTAKYQIQIQYRNPQQQIGQIKGINIASHRNVFKYQEVPTISTQKRDRKNAYALVEQSTKIDAFNIGYYEHKPINYLIKETLLNWAIGGSGNKFIQPDRELEENFLGFQDVLKIILPDNIGFQEISIRNYEIVLVTDSGDFMLDAVSGGIASLVDLAWQIYNFTYSKEQIVVLIDEVENHLHATMQRSVLPDLLDAFPNIQFIVSTHSPLAVASVKDSNVYAFRYDKENRVYSEKLDLVNKARTATEILNEVLGVPFTMPIWAEESLIQLVKKYRDLEITESNVNLMREEFRLLGLESLMPLAIKEVFEK
ncbi:DNA replication and repair protein RecF [termite gut metagenome]|uniref:DNA replication and repair protein RecF n=1 Tax=termite gut metagenome TaxID=433724 RepID=A0A5J4SCV9_9ZZZZ